jgi:hypothetical protein
MYRKKFDSHEYPGVSRRSQLWLARNGFRPDITVENGYVRSWRRIDANAKPHVIRELFVGERPNGKVAMRMKLSMGAGDGFMHVSVGREDGPVTARMQFGKLLKLAAQVLPATWLGADLGAIAKKVRTGVYNGETEDPGVREQG